MFLERSIGSNKKQGFIEVISGSMFSGKTEELIRRLKRVRLANQKVEIFKPVLDQRYSDENVVSHDSRYIHSTPVETAANILLLAYDVQVVGIDEAQFFDMGLIDVCNQLANQGTRVIVAGLDMDFQGQPFGPMPGLMAIAEYVTKVHAICIRCGNLAHYSFRKTPEEGQVLLGEKDVYEPLCRVCYLEALEERKKQKGKNE